MRGLAGLLFKNIAEIPVIAVPHHVAYIFYLMPFFQKTFGLFDSELCQVFDEGFSHLGLEKDTQIRGAHPGVGGEFV